MRGGEVVSPVGARAARMTLHGLQTRAAIMCRHIGDAIYKVQQKHMGDAGRPSAAIQVRVLHVCRSGLLALRCNPAARFALRRARPRSTDVQRVRSCSTFLLTRSRRGAQGGACGP